MPSTIFLTLSGAPKARSRMGAQSESSHSLAISEWRRAVVALALILPLAGCGFHPLYAANKAADVDPTLAAIKVLPVPNRVGQMLVDQLREQLNPAGERVAIRYLLTISLSVARSDLGLRRDNTSTRVEVRLEANLRLDVLGGKPTSFNENIRTITSFNQPDDAYAALVAEQKAQEEAASDMSREIAERLNVYVRHPKGVAGT
jgi:LPS-assembly lipoprotein